MSNFMENKDSLAKKASYLRIAAAELAEGMKEGNFRSLYRGQELNLAVFVIIFAVMIFVQSIGTLRQEWVVLT